MDEILLIGEINLDIYVYYKNKYHTDKYIIKPGGVTLNVAYSLKKFGLQPKIYSFLGEDIIGKGIKNEISKNFGLDLIKRSNFTNSIIYIISEDEIKIVGLKKEDPSFSLTPKVKKSIENAKIIHFSPYIFFNEINYEFLKKIIKYKKILSINLSLPLLKMEKFIKSLNYFDYIFMNLDEAKLLVKSENLKKIIKFLNENYKKCIITTKDFVLFISDGKEIKIDNKPIILKLDIGAGDYFIGGFLYGLYKNFSVEKSIKIGNKSAREHIINLNSSIELLNKPYII